MVSVLAKKARSRAMAEPEPETLEHKFWDTQPVPRLGAPSPGNWLPALRPCDILDLRLAHAHHCWVPLSRCLKSS